MTPTEILASLANNTPYRPNDTCHFCQAAKPLHETTCVWLEVLPYENTAVQLTAVVQLLAFLFEGAMLTKNELGFNTITLRKSFRITPEIRAIANKYGISVKGQ